MPAARQESGGASGRCEVVAESMRGCRRVGAMVAAESALSGRPRQPVQLCGAAGPRRRFAVTATRAGAHSPSPDQECFFSNSRSL